MYVSNENEKKGHKQIVFVSFYETPCSLIYEKKYDRKH